MLTLKIVSPERVEFDGNVISVKVPGTMGSFEVLDNHAPIISSLEKGVVEYTTTDKEKRQLNIFGGFVEVQKNVVSLCVELYDNE
jgi:F-type H+-transporting ATPase subunit epsilon